MKHLALVTVALALAGCASPEASPQEEPPPSQLETQRQPTPVPQPQPDGGFRDDTTGALATLVYVTERRLPDGSSEPSALVFSSDPEHKLFHRTPTERVNIKRMFKKQMQVLLDDLSARGFQSFPWVEQDYEQVTGPERAFTLFMDGKRRHVAKKGLDEAGLRAFSEIERLLINATMAVD